MTPDPTQRLMATALIVCAHEYPMSLSRAWCWRELRRLATEDCEYVGPATPENYRMTCQYHEPAIECGPCMASQVCMGANYAAMLRQGGVR